MGILLSVLQSIFSYFTTADSEQKYIHVNKDDDNENTSSRFSERPSTHTACRSSNQHKLNTYQSRIDNLKPDQIVYVKTRLSH